MGDIDELKKLSPSERVEKLREIEERNKKEIEEARKLMTESLREIEVEDELKRDIPIPQLTSVDVDSLFGQEEKDMFKTKRFVGGEKKEEVREIKDERTLEESIQREKPKDLPPDIVKQYTQQLEQMSNRVSEFRNMNEDHFQKYKSRYDEELKQMYDNVERMRHYESVSEQIQEMHLTDQIGGLLRGYKRGGV